MKVAIGQDSHKFEIDGNDKNLVLGGVIFEDYPGLLGNSDADVVLHAITNAISGITGKNILGSISDEMCKNGITDSSIYLKEALKYLKEDIVHLSISIECKFPMISPMIDKMKDSLSNLLSIPKASIGITATSR